MMAKPQKMTSRAALLQLGKMVARDLAGGRPSAGSLAVGMALSESPESTLTILDLLQAEARKKRRSDALLSAFLFMLCEVLTELRMQFESDPKGSSSERLQEIRRSLMAAVTAGRLAPELLMLIAQQFGAAKVDIGDELRSIMLDGAGEAAAGSSAEDIIAQFEALAVGLDHDPFLIHAQLSETLSSFPEEHQTALVSLLISSEVPAMRDASLGWLLHPKPAVSGSIAQNLVQATKKGLLSADSASRIVLIRNWVSQRVQTELDAAVRAYRQRATAPAPNKQVQISSVIASGCDGAGAQTFFVIYKRARKLGLASLLVKHGFGVRDAWVRDGMSNKEVGQVLTEVAEELDPFDASLEIVESAISHAMAINIAGGEQIPFGLVQFLRGGPGNLDR